MVAPPGPGRAVGACQQRFDLDGVQERHGSSLAAFGGDREHSCDQRGVLGVEVIEARGDKPTMRLRTTVTRQDGTVALEGTAVCYTTPLS